MKILFFTMRSSTNGSSRIHAFNYESIFRNLGATIKYDSPFPAGFKWIEEIITKFLDSESLFIRSIGKINNKIYWTLILKLLRTFQLMDVFKYDIIIIQKGLSRWFDNAIYERIVVFLIRRFKKKFVYHFDDILIGKKMVSITNFLIKKADLVVTVNINLFEHAQKLNKNIILIPENIKSKEIAQIENIKYELSSPIVIGWIGSGGSYKFEAIDSIGKALEKISQEFDISLRIISDNKFYFSKEIAVNIENVQWSQHVDDNFNCDIGINPVPIDMAVKGKGSYKLLKYLAHGIPSITSWTPDDFNRDEETCLVANNIDDWYSQTRKLIIDERLRKNIIKNGISEATKYSTEVLGEKYYNVLQKLVYN